MSSELVIDSSAALRACRSSRVRDRLQGYTLVAPPLLWSEFMSFLSEAVWRRELGAGEAESTLDTFDLLGIERRSPDRLYRTAWAIARELGWAKTYDAEFLALGRLSDCQVVTADQRLLRGAARTGLVIDAAAFAG